MVCIDKHAKSTDRRYLLTVRIVSGDIFGNFTADKLCRADIRLFAAYITYYIQHTLSHSTAHIKLPIRLLRNICIGILDITSYITVIIAHGDYFARRTVSVYGNGNSIVLVSKHTAHKGGCS